MTCDIIDNKTLSTLALNICLRGLAPEFGNDPHIIALRMHKDNLEAYAAYHGKPPVDNFTYEPDSCSDVELLASAYRFRNSTMESSKWALSDLWTRNLMLQVSIPYLEDTSPLLDYLMPMIVRLNGFHEALVEQSNPSPQITPESIRRSRSRGLDL